MWLNELQFFNQISVQVESIVVQNCQLLIVVKRWREEKNS